jgi:effector-binding domain-containing protein
MKRSGLIRKSALVLPVLLAIFFVSCSQEAPVEKPKTVYPPFDEKAAQNVNPGIIGIYAFPDLMVIAREDSGRAREIPAKVAESYSAIGKEMETCGLEPDGPVGQLMLNNDTTDFKFVCFVPIKKSPVRQPANRCRVRTLKMGDMLVYNYYGAYAELYTAYSMLSFYIEENGLKLTGATREFYITDPMVEPNPKKLLTRVMAPVAQKVPD